MEQKNDQSGSEEKKRYASSEEISRSVDRSYLVEESSVEFKNMISEMKRLQSSFDKFRRAYNDKKYCDTTRNQKKIDEKPISYNHYKGSSEEERSKKIVEPETYGSASFAERLKKIQMKIENENNKEDFSMSKENREIALDDSQETSEEESNESSEENSDRTFDENSDKPHGYGHETERKRNRRH